MILIYLCISYIFGIIWELNQVKLGLVPFLIIFFVGLFFYILNSKSKREKLFIIIICLLFIIFGFFYTTYRERIFKKSYSEDNYIFAGEILRKIGESNYYNKYIFKNTNNDRFILYIAKDVLVEENDLIEYKGKFEFPSAQRNKGGFDYSKYLYSQGLFGVIYAISDIQIVSHNFDIINIIRNSIINILGNSFPKEEFSIALGMVIGDTTFISEDIENSFKNSRHNTFTCCIRK